MIGTGDTGNASGRSLDPFAPGSIFEVALGARRTATTTQNPLALV
jgi:hypothetical protein